MSSLVGHYGYLIVAVFIAAEALGVPLPGETALIAAAGLFTGGSHPRLSVVALWVVAAAAATGGGFVGYALGRSGGYRLVRRYGHFLRIRERELKVARYLFERHGLTVVFFGRFAPVLRTYASFFAGVGRMPGRPFAVGNTVGAVLWSGAYVWAAHLAYRALTGLSGALSVGVGAIAAVAVVAVVVAVRRRYEQIATRAEEAHPEPLG